MATKAKQIKSEHTPINYTKASDTLDGHLAGIDAALTGGGGGGDTDQVLNVSTVPGVTASDALEYLDGYTQEIASINTSETNTSFVLKPDGTGGVEWGSVEAAGTTGNIQYKSAGTFAGTNKLNYVTNGTDSADVRISGYIGGHTASLSIRNGTGVVPKITLNYDESTNKSSISSPDTLHIGVVGIPSGSTLYDLPSTAGTNGQVLSTNGVGGTSWVSPSSPSTDQVTNASTVPGATASDALEYLDGYSKEITDILTSVTDTSLVLKPDGNGGVEFGPGPAAATLASVYNAGTSYLDSRISVNNTRGPIRIVDETDGTNCLIIDCISGIGFQVIKGGQLIGLIDDSVNFSPAPNRDFSAMSTETGNIILLAGQEVGSGSTGGLDLRTGNNTAPGAASFKVGNATGSGTAQPGLLDIQGGDAGTSSLANAGDVRIHSGDQKNTATNNRGGNLSLHAGESAGSGTAGSLSLDGGAALGTGNAGEVKLSGGDATAGTGGNVRLRAGRSTSGTSRVQVQIGTGAGTETDVAVFNSTTTLTSRNAASTGYLLALAADGALQYVAPSSGGNTDSVTNASNLPGATASDALEYLDGYTKEIETIKTAETNTSFVLSPDGTGGVTFQAPKLGYDYIVTNKKELCAAAASVSGGLITLQANKIYLIAGNIDLTLTSGIPGATSTDKIVLSSGTTRIVSNSQTFVILASTLAGEVIRVPAGCIGFFENLTIQMTSSSTAGILALDSEINVKNCIIQGTTSTGANIEVQTSASSCRADIDGTTFNDSAYSVKVTGATGSSPFLFVNNSKIHNPILVSRVMDTLKINNCTFSKSPYPANIIQTTAIISYLHVESSRLVSTAETYSTGASVDRAIMTSNFYRIVGTASTPYAGSIPMSASQANKFARQNIVANNSTTIKIQETAIVP